jgi:hypothetical protein
MPQVHETLAVVLLEKAIPDVFEAFPGSPLPIEEFLYKSRDYRRNDLEVALSSQKRPCIRSVR